MRRWLSLMLLSACVGCTYAATAHGPVHVPALLPVRSFPEIWVSSRHVADDERLAAAVAAHLARDTKLEVHRAEHTELERARQAGEIPLTAVVLFIELTLRDDVDHYWANMPVQSCGLYGCSTYYQSYWVSTPSVAGELVLTVYDGPSAKVLQRERIVRLSAGDEPQAAHSELLALLDQDLLRAVDELNREERVELYYSKREPVAKAVKLMEAGHWQAARELLERERAHLGGQSREQQGQFFFNLSMARRFAPGERGLDQQAYQDALRALQWAERLYPRPAHRVAMRHLQRDYEYQKAIAEQRAAREHNFAITSAPMEAPVEEPSAEGASAGGETTPAPSETGQQPPTPAQGAPASEKP